MPVSITLSLPPDFNDLVMASALGAAADRLNAVLPGLEPPVKKKITELTHSLLWKSPTGQSLLGGALRGELGVLYGPGAIKQIADAIGLAASARLVSPFKARAHPHALDGRFVIELVTSTLQEVLSLGAASFISENGHEVRWLEWLLTAGQSVVLADYTFEGAPPVRGRTGQGVMAKVKTRKGSQPWSVPGRYAGTFSDNWLTRTLIDLPPLLEPWLESEIKGKF